MSEWNSIRNEALRLRRAIAERAGLDPTLLIEPHRLVELAAKYLSLELNKVAEDSPILEGSVAILRTDTIYYRHDLSEGYREYSIAHEIGHHVLHKSSANCSSDDIVEFSIDGEAPTPVQQVEGYGKREKREREANLFALELLLPCEVLKQLFLRDDQCVSSISSTTNLPRSFIFSQLSTALLTPLTSFEPKEKAPRRDFELDESQSSAACAESGPLLVTAGPGTGKTQTLVKRVLFLLQQKKIAAERILALTFSNKATQEMRERIAEKAPEQAHRITVMTFHSYALELLRRYWHEAGLRADSEIIEKLDGILYLEEHLDELGLEYLQDLQDPTANLSPILTNISRAKDELVGPAEFRRMAEEQLAEAKTEEEKEKAFKAIESARVYEFYQEYLEREQLLDFGELIFKAVRLLQENDDIKATLRSKYDAILVDEFQDINRASGVLVKEIAGDGKGLWAVGDLRQSIYRWRGASPNNINKFEEDYPGAKRISLDTNYRSAQNIVGMFSEFARSMQSVVEPSFPGWTPSSDATASIRYNVFGTLDEEAEKIAEESKRLSGEGIPFRNQAVICRTNGQLNKLAERLVKRGVPVLFLGDLFARPEIRDLLSLLDVRSSETGTGLVRAGSLEQYSIPLRDINLILTDANKEGTDFQTYLEGESLPEQISKAGGEGFAKLRSSFRGIPKDSSAFKALCELLFSDGQHLKNILASDDDVLKAQNMLAIYQLVSFARSVEQRFADKGEDQIAAFLDHIRKLARFGEDRGFSQMPASAQEIDAVRLMTVHGSKGLEFDAVFIPYLVEGYFPNRRQGDSLPPPQKLSGKTDDTHLEEEECLFFVAVSRAKKSLFLTRAAQYSESRTSKPSNFLGRLGSHLPDAVVVKTEVEGQEPKVSEELLGKGTYHISQINRFDKCGREFYYRDVLRIEGKRKYSNPYQAFHKIVYDTLSAIQNVIKRGNSITENSAITILDELWQLGEMDSKPYSKIYRHHAEDMVKIFVKRIGETTVEICKEKLVFEFENGVISVTPEHLEIHTEGILVRKFKTGKGSAKDEGKSETADLEEAIIFLAAEKSFHGAPVKLIKTYLGSDTDREVAMTDRVRSNRLKTFEDTLTAIRAQRFEPSPSDRRCPNCPYFFICPQ